jgi:hypothetical protein
VTRTRPQAGCHDLAFRAAYPVGEAGEVALEDYARTLGRAAAAEVARTEGDVSLVTGVHLCGLGAPLTAAALTDIEDFARGLAEDGGSGGLGWS